MTTLCPHCGTNNRIGSNFCNNCGTDLRGDEQSPVAAEDKAAVRTTGEQQSDQTETIEDAEPQGHEAEYGEVESSEVENSDVETDAVENEKPAREGPPRPLFDLGLASVEQPWLGPRGASAETRDADLPAPDEEPSQPLAGGRRLVTGVQGLLDPLNISGGDETLPRSAFDHPAPAPSLTAEESERIRRVMGEAPVPAMQLRSPLPPRFPRLRMPWVFWLIGLSIALPVFGFIAGPTGRTVTWPGVEKAHATVEALPTGAHVLVYFAYDPATSGEMDLLAVPALRHLLDRRSNLTFITLNPNGPATVRHTVRLALEGRLAESEIDVALRRITARTVYLSGGAAVLPLVGAAPERTLKPAVSGRTSPLPQPALAVLLAPRTEDVQQWLELVQPLDGTPAVAYTAAGVDPMVRPYLDSGQLQGLVSGFDGADAYATLLDGSLPTGTRPPVQAVAQNWGHFALFFILLLGNVAGYLGRNREEA